MGVLVIFWFLPQLKMEKYLLIMNNTNGKGSRNRIINLKKYESNYDKINWYRVKEDKVFLVLDEKGMRLEFENKNSKTIQQIERE